MRRLLSVAAALVKVTFGSSPRLLWSDGTRWKFIRACCNFRLEVYE